MYKEPWPVEILVMKKYANRIDENMFTPFEIIKKISDTVIKVKAMSCKSNYNWVPSYIGEERPEGSNIKLDDFDNGRSLSSIGSTWLLRLEEGRGWRDMIDRKFELSDTPLYN
jgi:hypothetical protein